MDINPLLFDLLLFMGVVCGIFYMIIFCVGYQKRWSSCYQYRIVRRVMIFYLGICISVLFNFTKDYGLLSKQPLDLWNVSKNDIRPLETTQVISKLFDNPQKVVFITTTRYSIVQPAILTRIGQALFPVRENIIWIVVSTTIDADLGVEHLKFSPKSRSKMSEEENKTKSDGRKKSRKKQWMRIHLRSVKKTLKRFGVSFVLLRSHSQYLKNEHNGFRMDSDGPSISNPGLLTGLIWAVSIFKNGVVMLGNEEFTYNYLIFQKVKNTKVASVWPVGLGRPLGFSAPIVDRNSDKVMGYHTGYNDAQWGEVVMEIGGFAINIEYLKQESLDGVRIRKMAWDGRYTFSSIGIELSDIQPLEPSKILVWRTLTRQHPWPKQLKIKKSYKQSNMFTLFHNAYGVRYYGIKKITNFTEKVYSQYI